jgi:leucyl-tRNA synthetase
VADLLRDMQRRGFIQDAGAAAASILDFDDGKGARYHAFPLQDLAGRPRSLPGVAREGPMYDFRALESKWQQRWAETGLHTTSAQPKKKYYVLEMFAYPSGDIHMGHFRNYSIGDVVARFKMMQGFDVLHPFGWDAFGQPAEGAAIKHKIQPRAWTLKNIETGDATLKRMAISYDWDREFRTCDPEYYKWTQWIFLQMHKAGLAYRGSSWVNWCDVDQWALTNEQSEGGICWRCKNPIRMKELTGCWFFRTSQYAERLLKDIDKLGGWPETVRTIQRNWIGRSEGAEIEFKVDGGEPIRVFTTRPDTIYGVTFMAVSPESPLARTLPTDPARRKAVDEYIQKALVRDEAQREKEKDGVFTGRLAINPFSGEKVQLWVADYVLGGYGTGVVMGVPAHDQRDFQFAKKYGIPMKVVINPQLDAATMTEAFVDDGAMCNSGPFDGTPNQEGIQKVAAYAKEKGIGGPKVTYKLRDWLISRQRYWGCPIPIIHCATCGAVPVPEKDLPVMLPVEIENVIPKGRSPLADSPAFMKTTCPTCGGAAERDPDTMDTFIDSSWYHFRYVDPRNDREIWARNEIAKWAPVDLYIGGVEHARGHCLYFRFVTKFAQDQGWCPVDEPAIRLFNHGMVCDETGRPMSKSLGNVVAPGDIFDKYGVDVARLAMFFFAPSEDEIKWSEKGLIGAQRFVYRVWETVSKNPQGTLRDPSKLSAPYKEMRLKIHAALQKATASFDGDLHFNTVIAALYEALNAHDAAKPPANDDEKGALREFVTILAKILAPLAPFLGEEFHEMLSFDSAASGGSAQDRGGWRSVFRSGWPAFDPAALKTDSIEVPVQVNGKLRGTVTLPAGTPDAAVQAAALAHEAVVKALEGKPPKKVIVVKGKLVNVVV